MLSDSVKTLNFATLPDECWLGRLINIIAIQTPAEL